MNDLSFPMSFTYSITCLFSRLLRQGQLVCSLHSLDIISYSFHYFVAQISPSLISGCAFSFPTLWGFLSVWGTYVYVNTSFRELPCFGALGEAPGSPHLCLLPSHRTNPSPKDPWILLLEKAMVLEIKICALGV